MKAVALYRVSTREQGDSGLGIEAQAALVQAHCIQHGWQLVSEHYETGVSGKAPLSKRTGLTEAIAATKAFGADVLVIKAVDRLARDPLIHLTIEKTLTKLGVRIVSVSGEGTENDDPASVFYRRIMSATSELEASLISARTKQALAAKKARGERLGRPPFGFTVKKGKLVPKDNEDYEVVRLVLKLRDTKKRKPTPERKPDHSHTRGPYYYTNKLKPISLNEIATTVSAATGSYCSTAKVARIVRQWGTLNNLPGENQNG
jgi:DNA invertase Pin-like site-specific DNA recombinase